MDGIPGTVPVQKFLFDQCVPQSYGSDPAFQVNPDPDTDTIRIQGFDDQKVNKKNTAEIFLYLFFIKNCNLLVQATEEAFSPQKRTSSTVLFLHSDRSFNDTRVYILYNCRAEEGFLLFFGCGSGYSRVQDLGQIRIFWGRIWVCVPFIQSLVCREGFIFLPCNN